MGLGKKIAIALVVVMIAGAVFVPTTIAVILIPFLGGNSCVAADLTSEGTEELTGQPAEEYLETLRRSGVSEEEIQKKLQLVATIYKTGMERPTPATLKEIWTVVGTGIQETNLTNLPDIEGKEWDSAGFLQQRPSQGWGTAAQVVDPVYATDIFLDRLEAKFSPAAISVTPMKDMAIAVQNPSITAYGRWNWDKTAAELVAMVLAPGAQQSCPTTGWHEPLDNAHTTQGSFDPNRLHPILGYRRPHDGADFVASYRQPVYAIHSGTVTSAKMSGQYGNVVFIDHGGGISSASAHLDEIAPEVTPGATVQAGQIIGYAGDTGLAQGVHLHFEIKVDGEFKNPADFFRSVGIEVTD